MPARIPALNKSPFVIDPRPLQEMGSAHAGLLATSPDLRSIDCPQDSPQGRRAGDGTSQFRDGIVPARQASLNCARMAFDALPAGIKQRYFRGDSASQENELIDWLRDPARASEPGWRIGFSESLESLRPSHPGNSLFPIPPRGNCPPSSLYPVTGAAGVPGCHAFSSIPALICATDQKASGPAAKNRRTDSPSRQNPAPKTNRAADLLKSRACARSWEAAAAYFLPFQASS